MAALKLGIMAGARQAEWPSDHDAGRAANGGHVLGKGGAGHRHHPAGKRSVEHPEDSGRIPIGKRGMGHVQPRDLGCEGEHIARLDAVGHLGNALGWNHAARVPVQPALDRPDVAEHVVAGHRHVVPAMLGHEAERAHVLHPSQLRTAIFDEPAFLPVGNPSLK